MTYLELRLFNTLKKEISKLDLHPHQKINIYLCGPTVYDHLHVGNMRPIIIFDVLHRLFLHLNLKVNYIQNITDIDDKIIAKAEKEQKSEKEISKFYTASYWANLSRYNVISPSRSPLVTDYLPQIQNFIASLLEKNAAYQQTENVYFRIEGTTEYGKLSGQNLDKLKSGSRKIVEQNKLNKLDFGLWKGTKKGVVWSSPWGAGRPGWHTECVVFIQELFQGQTIDIHGGGQDLLFPHHENERIQYLANYNRELSKIWLHIAHLHWNEEKMSKSLGNVISAQFFAQQYGSNAFRYLILNSHYNQVINLNEKLIQQAVDYLQKVKNLLKKLTFYCYTEKIKVTPQKTKKKVEIINCLLNNLNTVKVLFWWEEIITLLHQSIDRKEKGKIFREAISDFYFIRDILGFKLTTPLYSSEVQKLIQKWQTLRQVGEYYQADEIRRKLQKYKVL